MFLLLLISCGGEADVEGADVNSGGAVEAPAEPPAPDVARAFTVVDELGLWVMLPVTASVRTLDEGATFCLRPETDRCLTLTSTGGEGDPAWELKKLANMGEVRFEVQEGPGEPAGQGARLERLEGVLSLSGQHFRVSCVDGGATDDETSTFWCLEVLGGIKYVPKPSGALGEQLRLITGGG